MADESLQQLKHCTKCGLTKPLVEFHKDKQQKDGRARYCAICRRAYARQRPPRRETWRKRNPLVDAEWQASDYRRNKDRIDAQKSAWLAANRETVRERQRLLMRRRRTDPKLKLESNVSRAVNRALRGTKGRQPSFEILGFTVVDLTSHLERQFTAGMDWANYGRWHVDHVIPLTSFVYESPSDPEFRAAWALSNLRPLWATENISKGARRLLLL